MNKNKWFLNGGRGSGRTFRLLCETYENKIANLQHTVDTLQGFLDHDIEYDMDKTIQEQKIKIAELEKENKDIQQSCENYYNEMRSYKNKVADLEDKLANADYQLEGRDNEIRKLEKENKVLAQNLEDTEIINKALEKENAELKDDNKVMADNYSKMEQKFYDNLTKAKDIIKKLIEFAEMDDREYEEEYKEAEQLLNGEVEKCGQ